MGFCEDTFRKSSQSASLQPEPLVLTRIYPQGSMIDLVDMRQLYARQATILVTLPQPGDEPDGMQPSFDLLCRIYMCTFTHFLCTFIYICRLLACFEVHVNTIYLCVYVYACAHRSFCNLPYLKLLVSRCIRSLHNPLIGCTCIR